MYQYRYMASMRLAMTRPRARCVPLSAQRPWATAQGPKGASVLKAVDPFDLVTIVQILPLFTH